LITDYGISLNADQWTNIPQTQHSFSDILTDSDPIGKKEEITVGVSPEEIKQSRIEEGLAS
jgi:hypothetical protein